MKRQILRHLPTWIGAGILVANAAICASAHGQWLPDRKYKEGNGIRLGERLELHPGVVVRAGYDTNVFRADQNLVGSGVLAVTPHVNLSSVGPQRLQGQGEDARAPIKPKFTLDSGASLSYFYYFKDGPPRGVEVDVDGSVTVMPERPVHGTFEVGYQRTIRPFSQPGDPSGAPGTTRSTPNYSRNTISPAALIGFSSRGGVFSSSVGYRPTFIIQEDSESGNDFSYLNVWRSRVPINIAWKFLPHTGLIHESEIAFQRYFDTDGSNIALSDGTTLRSRLGLNGAITKAIALQGMAGFATAFYEDPLLDEYQEAIGEVSLAYRFMQDNKLQVGYSRDVSPSFTGGWQLFDRGKIELNMLLAGALSLSSDVSVGLYRFGSLKQQSGDDLGDGTDQREDVRVEFGVHGEYRVTHYLAFTADFETQALLTDFEYASNLPGNPVDPAEFTYYQVFGGVRAFY